MDTIESPLRGIDSSYDRDWSALVASAIGLIFSVGTLTIYTFGMFIIPIGHEFKWTRGQISGAVGVGQISLVVASLLWGVLLDRFGPRKVILSAVAGLGLGLALFSRLTGPLWHLSLLFALRPLLSAAANPLGYNGILVRRFNNRLGLALGTSLMGLGLGAALLPALAQHFIATQGWRSAYLILAGLTLAVGLPAAWIATRRVQGPVVRAASANGTTIWPLIGTRAFVLICGCFFLLGAVGVGVLTHLVPMITDHGLTPAIAAKITGLVGVSTLVSRGAMGWLLDRIHAPYLLAAVSVLCAGMCLLLIKGGGSTLYSVVAVLIGLTAGAEVDFIGFLVRKYFGTAEFGRLYAVAFAAYALGPGPVIIGYSFDHFHGYRPGLLIFVGLSLLAAALTFFLPRYKQTQPELQTGPLLQTA